MSEYLIFFSSFQYKIHRPSSRVFFLVGDHRLACGKHLIDKISRKLISSRYNWVSPEPQEKIHRAFNRFQTLGTTWYGRFTSRFARCCGYFGQKEIGFNQIYRSTVLSEGGQFFGEGSGIMNHESWIRAVKLEGILNFSC